VKTQSPLDWICCGLSVQEAVQEAASRAASCTTHYTSSTTNPQQIELMEFAPNWWVLLLGAAQRAAPS